MKYNKASPWTAAGLTLLFGLAVTGAFAQQKAEAEKAKPETEKAAAEANKAETNKDAAGGKTFLFDKGPDKIDVSKYPKEQQENYTVFARRCSKCHTLARPINSPYCLPEEWDAYVHKMQKKKRSGLDSGSVKKIISFLTYDSQVRKKDAIEKKLKENQAQPKKGD